jgi:hypothetical protein
MESRNPERPEEAQGLHLVRSFLLLPPDKRRLVLDLAEELLREQGARAEETDGSLR